MDEATARGARAGLDRWFWLAVVIAALVVIPRSLMITAAHSPTQDEQTHLRIGLSNLTGNPSGLIHEANDAPLGQMICALPMVATGCLPGKPMNPATLSPQPLASEDAGGAAAGGPSPELRERLRAARRDVLFGHRFPPDTLRLLIAAWKAVLFLPAAGLIFHWCRWLYGLPAAWLGLALVLVDPTFAAHIPPATPDVLAVEGILFACYFTWRVMEDPGRKRLLVAASVFIAAALLLKLTTVILPAVLVAMAAAFVVRRDRFAGRRAVRRRWNVMLAGVLLTCVAVWALTGFDWAVPGQWVPMPAEREGVLWWIYPALQHPWPAGHFIQVLCSGFDINASLRWAYLFGQARPGGWWYYFPAVAAYKVPLGYFVVFVAAVASVVRVRPRFEELSLVIPLAGWLLMLLFMTHIDTGFRHFLPAYVFVLMLASRAVAAGALRVVAGVLWAAVGASLAHTLSYHPDYLSYFNRPIDKPWLVCNDSNVDWVGPGVGGLLPGRAGDAVEAVRRAADVGIADHMSRVGGGLLGFHGPVRFPAAGAAGGGDRARHAGVRPGRDRAGPCGGAVTGRARAGIFAGGGLNLGAGPARLSGGAAWGRL
jgi:hypothetical protein